MKDVNVRIVESKGGSVLRGIRQLPEKAARADLWGSGEVTTRSTRNRLMSFGCTHFFALICVYQIGEANFLAKRVKKSEKKQSVELSNPQTLKRSNFQTFNKFHGAGNRMTND